MLSPYFSYEDASGALKWLEEAFGFQKVVAYDGPDGMLMHAEMRFGTGVLMLGTGTPPHSAPGSHGVYVVVDDVDAHYERARAAGATIVYPPEDTEFGTRRYRALDIEGYEWSFGTYSPGGS